MEQELKDLKRVLRNLVVTSPSAIDVLSLMRNYRKKMGHSLELKKFGCRDPVSFLKKYFSDSFLLRGSASNPIVNFIVPDSMKPINKVLWGNKPLHNWKLKGNEYSKIESVQKTLVFRRSTKTTAKDEPTSTMPLFVNTLRRLKRAHLKQLRRELTEMILEEPNGVWCTDVLRMYSKRYGRELDYIKFGFISVLSLACTLKGCVARMVGDNYLLQDERAPPPPSPPPPAPARVPTPTDTDDALPYIDFEPGVFPLDCVQLTESIPSSRLDGVVAGALLEVEVGEVYSPSHFWMLLLGDQYIAMQKVMEEMNVYYNGSEGRERRLCLGAVRVGHYCSSNYYGVWHRSLIVKVLDSETVKVRHVDYGTVETVASAELRPLRREWAALPAQAVRARLAAVRPPGAASRWPRAVAARFLADVTERPIVANVVTRDSQEDILEVLLIDTSTDEYRIVSDELVRSGYADPRADAATGTGESYLSPHFAALESGDTPNYGEIYVYLRDGIALDDVCDYRRHVPPCLPMPTRRPPQPVHVTPPPASAAPPVRRCRSAPAFIEPRSPEKQVTLSTSVCEVFALLSEVNTDAAQRFMMEAIQRARQARPSASPATIPISNLHPAPLASGDRESSASHVSPHSPRRSSVPPGFRYP